MLGKYRVDGPLGAGGMGIVMRATHLQLGQPVALKFLIIQKTPAEAQLAADRFLREAKATFRLRGENSVRVLDVGSTPKGTPFIVMELLEGKDLRDVLNQRGALPVGEAVQYILQVCSALEEAHAYGIVHRDLKPRNLFLTKKVDGSPCVKVLDFGISKVAGEGDDNPLTNPQMAIGSPRYMAPEQWMSSKVDGRADIYATAMVLYELLTGQVALPGLQLGELIRRLSAGAIPSPRDVRPELPEPLCKVVLKALRPHPDERYPTITHFAAALREVAPPVQLARPRPVLGQTAATAIVDKEVMLARAALTSALGPPATAAAPVPAAGANDIPRESTTDDFELKTEVTSPPPMDSSRKPQKPQNLSATMQSVGATPAPPKPVYGATLPIGQVDAAVEIARAQAARAAPPPVAAPVQSRQNAWVAPPPSEGPGVSPVAFSLPRPEPSYAPPPSAAPVLSMQVQSAPIAPAPAPTPAPVQAPPPPQNYGGGMPMMRQPPPARVAEPRSSGVPAWVVFALVAVALAATAVTLVIMLGPGR